MLDFTLLIKGAGIGILFSAPIGPVNIMCIQLAFRRGFFAGLAAGLGAVLADVLFAAMAAYGITAVARLIEGYSQAFQLAGGLMLIIFGVRIFTMHPHLDDPNARADSVLATAFASFGMTVTNPATVLGFFAVFGSLGDLAPESGDYVGATLLVLGVLIGGAAWWLFVASLVATVRDRMTDKALERINQVAGGVLILFGTAILARLAAMVIGQR